jgi:hypothetical protein
MRDLVGAMDDEYPLLQRLVIRSWDEPSPNHNHNRHRNRSPSDAATVTLHEKFRATPMHRLVLSNVALPASSRLLSGAGADLVSLRLFKLPAASRDFHPVHLTTQLAALSRLEMLTICFSAPAPNREITRSLQGVPTTTRIALPRLHVLAYRGSSAYLEGILARLDAPDLRTLKIKFFNQLTFSLPSLYKSVRRIDAFVFRSIALHFRENFAMLIVDPLDEQAGGTGSGTQPLHVQVSGKALDWQVSSISQICSALAPLLAQTESLTLGFYRVSPGSDHGALGVVGVVEGRATAGLQGDDVVVDRAQWRALLRTFAGVRMLQLVGKQVGDLFSALQLHLGEENDIGNGEGGSEGNGNDDDGGAVTPEILPALQELVPRGWGHTDEAFAPFVAGRAAAGYPVRFVRNRW